MHYLLDTCIIIEMLKLNDKINDKVRDVISNGDIVSMDALSYYEAKSEALHKNKMKQLKRLEKLLKDYRIWLHDDLDIINKAAQNWANLQKSGKSLDMQDIDILLASNAIFRDFVLVTDNEKHFERFKDFGLKFENWNK